MESDIALVCWLPKPSLSQQAHKALQVHCKDWSMLPGLSTCYLLMGKGWALEAEPGLCLPTKWVSGIPVWIIRALSPGIHIVVGCVIRGQSLHFVLCSEKNTLSLIWNPRGATQISVNGKWGCGHTHRTHASIEAERKGEKMGKSQEEEHWAFGKCQEKCES